MTDQTELSKPSASIELASFLHDRRYAKYGRFVFAVLGAIPWVGALLGAAAALHAEAEQGRVNEIHKRWMEEHEAKIAELSETIATMMKRLEQLGETADERIQEEGYLGLVRYGFRIWDEAPTKSKRDRVRQTLTNAAASRICSDDVVRLFLNWLRIYDDLHLRVIRVIHEGQDVTRGYIWEQIHGEEVREDSAEADLFKLMIRDLTMGSVIRQHRDTTSDGRFVARRPAQTRKAKSRILESAFEEKKPYELTELGSRFVHYAMNELVPRLGQGADREPPPQPDGVPAS